MPRRHPRGGYEPDLHVVTEVIEMIGAADVSAAWLLGLEVVANWFVGRTSKRAQEDVFGADPDAHVAGSDHPGLGRRVKGGVRVSGRWPYASGSLHATWASLAARVTDDAGVLIDTVIGL